MLDNLLKRASQDKMKSIAFPALGTGTLGFPRDVVAQIMLDSVFKFSNTASNSSLKEIFFVTFHLDKPTVKSFEKEFIDRGKPGKGRKSQTTGAGTGVSQSNVRKLAKKTSSTNNPVFHSRLEDNAGLSIKLGPLIIELASGDITDEKTDAVVVIGNKMLNFGGAVGRAVIKKEGTSFEKKGREDGPQNPGTTRLLNTTVMPAKHVIHIVPPSPDNPSYKDMLKATFQMLADAEKYKLRSISIPAIGAGLLKYPPQKSASIILHAIAGSYASGKMQKSSTLEKVRIVIFDENMLETFAEELVKIIESPETYLENLEDSKGIVDWIRDKGKAALKSISKFFSLSNTVQSDARPSKHEASTIRNSKANEFYDVTLIIYSTDQRKIKRAKERIEKMVDDNITPVTTRKPGFAQLTELQKAHIITKARMLDVSVTFGEDGLLTIVGYHEDTSKIMEYCHEILLKIVEEESQMEKENLVAEIVQWIEVIDDEKTEYDAEVNMKIESAYTNGTKHLELELDDNGRSYKCYFNLEGMTGKTDRGISFSLERVKKANGK